MATGDKARQATHDDIVRLAGDLGELKVARIEETGATVGDLEEACALISGDGEATGDLAVGLSGAVAEIYGILTADETAERDR